MAQYPTWQAHLADGYDRAMRDASVTFLTRIETDQPYRLCVLQDPLELHRTFFLPFAPSSHLEYAGTCRGTVGTSLEGRIMGAPSLAEPGREFAFENPAGLPGKVEYLLGQVSGELENARRAQPYAQLLLLTHMFCWFGKLHPFLDGNGHIQRALFAALALELGIPLSPRFALHPRSYDRLLAWPLEMFTRAKESERPACIATVAEYLSTWLAGPFDQPGAGIPPA